MVVKIIKNKDGSITRLENVTPNMTITPVKKVVKKAPTLRQEAVIAMVGNGRSSKAEILRKAGYSPSVVDHPDKVFDSPVVANEVEKVLLELRAHRDEVLERMRRIYRKAGYTSLSITLANMNKDIELLSGKPTSREEYVLPAEEQEKLDKLLEMNKNGA